MYITVKEASERWEISTRRVRSLCGEGKIAGVLQNGRIWKIPADAEKPADRRYRSAEKLLALIGRKKEELDQLRPFTQGELAYFQEEFAIEGNTLSLKETDLVLRGLTVDRKPLKDHLEVIGT